LRPGDEIRIEGVPDGGEPAAIDYVEIQPDEPAPVYSKAETSQKDSLAAKRN
jgi:hypothetical protein